MDEINKDLEDKILFQRVETMNRISEIRTDHEMKEKQMQSTIEILKSTIMNGKTLGIYNSQIQEEEPDPYANFHL